MATRTRNQVIAFRVTPAEAKKIREKVRQSGLSQREYLLRAALEQPILVIHELKPILTELRAWGKNLNQLTVAANTLVLLQDMPDVSKERRRELIGQIENFVATLKDPYCKALAETRGLMMQLRRQSEVER